MYSKTDLIQKISHLEEELSNCKAQMAAFPVLAGEKKYKLLLDNSIDVIWQLDQKLNTIYISPSIKNLTGYTPEEWISEKLSARTPSVEFFKIIRHALEAFKNYNSKSFKVLNTKFRCKDGSFVPVEITGNVIQNEAGSPVVLQGTARDISARLKAEQTLKENDERYKQALAAAEEGIWDWILGNDNVYFSDQWKAQLGYEENELENFFSTWQNLLHPFDYGRVHRELNAYLNHPEGLFQSTFRLKHKDGSYRWIHSRAGTVKKEDGSVIRMIGAHTDITNQVNVEEALKESEQKLKTVISEAQIVLFSLDKNGRFTFSDGRGLSAMGFKPGELNNMSIFEVFKDYPRIINLTRRALKGKSVRNNVEYKGIFFDTIYTPIKNASGNIESVIGVLYNTTDYIEAEKKLQAVNEDLEKSRLKAEESDKLKSAFLANMSHEIRTPMNSILGFSELLRDCKSDVERDEFVDIIHSNGEVLLNLLNDILDLSKIEGGQLDIKPALMDVNSLMRELKQLYLARSAKLNKPDLKIKFTIPDEDKSLQLKSDRARLFQVMVNLIDNAIKFTEKGLIEFGYELDGLKVRFFVRDSGIGIKTSDFKLIFERFAQVKNPFKGKYGGTGLGLSISKKLVELLGGELKVESEVNKGSLFYFSLPMSVSRLNKPKQLKKTIPGVNKKWNNKTILIVEDIESNKLLIENILSPLNVNILTTSYGEEAVEICQHTEVNLVLMDLKLPNMSGFEATTKIKEINKNIYVVAQTALTLKNEKQHSFECGCDDYLTKPIKPKSLIKTIHKYLS